MLSSLSELKGYESIIPIEAKEDLADLPEMGICINATSLGLNQNDPLPLDMAFLTPQWAVYDMVYNPQKTQLFIEAKKLGCAAKTGLGMLVHQGAQALEIWTEQKIDAQIMHNAGENTLYNQAN
jgi:shikimate dehydrogenase